MDRFALTGHGSAEPINLPDAPHKRLTSVRQRQTINSCPPLHPLPDEIQPAPQPLRLEFADNSP